MYNPQQHNRKSIRLKYYDYTNANWYYVTICTKDKECFFVNIENGKMFLNNAGKIVQEEWLKTKMVRNDIELESYIIMPNHFHGIIIKESDSKIVGATRRVAPNTPEFRLKPNSLGSIIGQFKSIVTKRVRKTGLVSFQWHRNYYEHIIRNDKDLYNIKMYIELNPIRWEMDEYY